MHVELTACYLQHTSLTTLTGTVHGSESHRHPVGASAVHAVPESGVFEANEVLPAQECTGYTQAKT